MFHVTEWDTDKIICSWEKLAVAKRYCRGQGHTGELAPNGLYPPVAFVADDAGNCVYNPVFRGILSPDVAELINAQQSDSF